MTDITYRIDKKLKTPWFGKPHIEYQLVKEYDYFDYDSISCWGKWIRADMIILKSKDFTLINKFLKELRTK